MGVWNSLRSSLRSATINSRQALGLQLNLAPEREIVKFDRLQSLENWIYSSDKSIGGSSVCHWGIYDPSLSTPEDTEYNKIERVNVDDNVPSAVFCGTISTHIQPTEPDIVRSGFCAARMQLPPNLLLHGYEGLAMRVMTDGRIYRVNVQMDSWNPFNLYMGFIRTPPNQWVDIELPFQNFMLTAKGFVKVDDETELDPGKLRNLGFAIADNTDGDFELRVQWVKAVAKVSDQEKKAKHIGITTEDIDDDDLPDETNQDKRVRKPDDLAV